MICCCWFGDYVVRVNRTVVARRVDSGKVMKFTIGMGMKKNFFFPPSRRRVFFSFYYFPFFLPIAKRARGYSVESAFDGGCYIFRFRFLFKLPLGDPLSTFFFTNNIPPRAPI